MQASVENAVAGPQNGPLAESVSEACAGEEKTLVRFRNVACLRPVDIGNNRLREKRLFVPQAIIKRQFSAEFPCILGVEIDIRGADILLRVSELLRERAVILRTDSVVSCEILASQSL